VLVPFTALSTKAITTNLYGYYGLVVWFSKNWLDNCQTAGPIVFSITPNLDANLN